jgi:DNA-binding PadR family transcriptional regulator
VYGNSDSRLREQGCIMSRVEKLESQITELSSEELAALREWFIEFDSRAWDGQFEADARAGKLDSAAERALKDHAAGRSSRL